MLELLHTFGVNWILLVAQIVNFLLIFWLLKKLLYKPVFEMLSSREKRIKEGLKQAEDARILLEKTTQKEQEVLRKAQADAKVLLEETRKQRDEILKEAEIAAKKQAQQVLDEARKQIVSETKEAQKYLSLQISGLAVEFLQKSAGELFSKEDQEIVVKNAVKKLKKRAD
jgi:F-type H+-transporting ATPase subunit b